MEYARLDFYSLFSLLTLNKDIQNWLFHSMSTKCQALEELLLDFHLLWRGIE